MKLQTLLFGLLTASATLFTSCKDKDKELPAPQPQTPATPPPAPLGDHGFIRVVNNLAVAPNQSQLYKGKIVMDVDDKQVAEADVAQASSYQAVAVGAHKVELHLPDKTTPGYHAVVFNNLPVEKDKRYSLFTYNTGNSAWARVAEDVLPAPVAGKAHVRVVHLAQNTSSITVQESNSTAAPWFANTDWGSVSAYIAVDARSYPLAVHRPGSSLGQLLEQPVTLESGKTYSLVLRGTEYPSHPDEQLAFDVIVDQ